MTGMTGTAAVVGITMMFMIAGILIVRLKQAEIPDGPGDGACRTGCGDSRELSTGLVMF